MQKQNAHIANTNPPIYFNFFLKVLKTQSASTKGQIEKGQWKV